MAGWPQTLTVHGNAYVSEGTAGLVRVHDIPGTDVVGLAQGWGRTFGLVRGGRLWFHCPIPVAMDAGYRWFIQSVWASFKSATIGVSRIAVWDGSTRIYAFDGVPEGPWPRLLVGDWSSPRELRTWAGPYFGNIVHFSADVVIRSGLCLCLLVEGDGGTITFQGATADVREQ